MATQDLVTTPIYPAAAIPTTSPPIPILYLCYSLANLNWFVRTEYSQKTDSFMFKYKNTV